MNATVTWRTGLPDADTTVLVYTPADGEVWLGFYDGECWRGVDASRLRCKVTHWAHLPEPPREKAGGQLSEAA
jgi:hypothetical protein